MKVAAEHQCGRLTCAAHGFGLLKNEADVRVPLFDVVSKQCESLVFAGSRASAHPVSEERRSLPLRCQTRRGQESMEKKNPKHSALCSKEYWKLSLRLFGHRR